MRQGRLFLSVCVPLALLAVVAMAPVEHAGAAARPAAARVGKADGLRQFTGLVTAIDKNTITVEKRGKKPRTVVFVRDEAMTSSGEIAKETRVTVYYRDQGEKMVAHRIVAKPVKRKA